MSNMQSPVTLSSPNVSSSFKIELRKRRTFHAYAYEAVKGVVFMQFRSLVFTRFIVENERSHSAVLTGTRAAMEASFEKFGYMS